MAVVTALAIADKVVLVGAKPDAQAIAREVVLGLLNNFLKKVAVTKSNG